MKSLLTTVVLGLLLVQSVGAIAPVEKIYGTGYWKGDMYAVTTRSGEHLLAVKWDPEKEQVPLSIPEAIKIARQSLKKMVDESYVGFRCEEVKIAREVGYWFYVITFQSMEPERIKGVETGGMEFVILPFVVYLDGGIDMPWKRNA